MPAAFQGRQEELRQLQQFPPVVLVQGPSGVGKSRLVRRFHETCGEPNYLLQGKAEETASEPYAVLRSALACVDLQLTEEERKLLAPLLPVVKGNTPDRSSSLSLQERSSTTLGTSKQLAYPLLQLLNKLSRHRRVIFFLDDLQWADAASLEVIQILATNPGDCMLIGAHRSGSLDNFRSEVGSFLDLTLNNFTREQTKALVQDWLDRNEVIDSLVDVIYDKTLGNAYYIETTLRILQERELLFYSHHFSQWRWDAARIREELSVTENVVELLVEKLQSFAPDLKNVLCVAACLRSKVDLSLLEGLLHELELEPPDLVSALRAIVSEGLLEETQNEKFTFVHDRVQESARQLLRECPSLTDIDLRIGAFLMQHERKDWVLFTALDNLNAHSLTEVAKLCDLQVLLEAEACAGKKALEKGAFEPASAYLLVAVEILERNPYRWSLDYDVCLAVYQSAAEALLGCGRYKEGARLIEELGENAHNVMDKASSLTLLADSLGRQRHHSEAVLHFRRALVLLGERFRSVSLPTVFLELHRVKRLFDKRTDQSILSLPDVSDRNIKMRLDMFIRLSVRAAWTRDHGLFFFCILRAVRLTLANGLAVESACAFSSLAFRVLLPFGWKDFSLRLTNLAEKVLARYDVREHQAKMLYIKGNFIDAFSTPLPSLAATLDKAYVTGMESGDHEIATLCLCSTNVNGFMLGVPLKTLEEDACVVLDLIEQYQQQSVKCLFVPWRQMLTGIQTTDSSALSWREEALIHLQQGKMKDGEDTFEQLWTYLSRMNTAFFFGDIELADVCRRILKFYRKVDIHFNSATMNAFLGCLVACAMYHKKGTREYRTDAKKELDRMRKFVRTGGVNLIHRLQLMEAEVASLWQRPVDYETAIHSATRAGFLSDAALANELCAAYCARQNDHGTWAQHYITHAYQLYDTWGCASKLAHIRKVWDLDEIPHKSTRSTFKVRYDLFSTRQELERNFSRRETLSEKIDPSALVVDPTSCRSWSVPSTAP